MKINESLKPHWERLIAMIQERKNGKCVFDFQDGLPIRVVEIESRDRDIDLTKETI